MPIKPVSRSSSIVVGIVGIVGFASALALLAFAPECVRAQAARVPPPPPLANPVPAPEGLDPDSGAAVILLDVPKAPATPPPRAPTPTPASPPVPVPVPVPGESGGAVILHDAPQRVVPSARPEVSATRDTEPESQESTIRLQMQHNREERAALLREDSEKYPTRVPWFVMIGGAGVCMIGVFALALSDELREDSGPSSAAIAGVAGACGLGAVAVVGGFIALRITLHKRPHRQEIRELNREYKELRHELTRTRRERADLWHLAPRVAATGHELGLSLSRAF